MKLLPGLGRPVRERTYVPNAHGTEGYRDREHLVCRIDLLEDGPDSHLKVFSRGFTVAVGHLHLPARDAEPFLERLFRDPPTVDREVCGKLIDALEVAIQSGDIQGRMRARRVLLRAMLTMAADLSLIEGLPPEDPHAFDVEGTADLETTKAESGE